MKQRVHVFLGGLKFWLLVKSMCFRQSPNLSIFMYKVNNHEILDRVLMLICIKGF